MALIAVLYSLAAGERQEDMKLGCDRSLEGRVAPAALGVAAQLQDAVISSFWYKVFDSKRRLPLNHGLYHFLYAAGSILLGTHAVPLPVIYRGQHALRNSCLFVHIFTV